MTATRPVREKKNVEDDPLPSRVAPGVYVGGWDDAVNFEGVRYCVLDELPKDAPADEGFTIYDGRKRAPIVANLDRLAEKIDGSRKAGQPVLVFCGHGVRRSPLGAAWYLHRSEGITLDDAYARVQKVRPQVEHARDWIKHTESLGSG
jgi:hypothetical protein